MVLNSPAFNTEEKKNKAIRFTCAVAPGTIKTFQAFSLAKKIMRNRNPGHIAPHV